MMQSLPSLAKGRAAPPPPSEQCRKPPPWAWGHEEEAVFPKPRNQKDPEEMGTGWDCSEGAKAWI